MRVAYLSASVVPSRSANSVHVMKMCAALARNGNAATLFARRGGGEDAHAHYGASGFELQLCRNVQTFGVGAALYAREVRRRLRAAAGFDVLYARHLYSLALAADLGAPLIFEAHTPPANALQFAVERWLYARPNFLRLVVISQALADWYLAKMPLMRRKSVLVAHDAADDAIESPPVARGAAKRFAVGYVGQLYAGKGMEIISQLPRRIPEADFHIIGGTEADLTHWRAQANAENIIFHGYMPPSALPQQVAKFDVVLAPYQRKVAVYGKRRDIASWMSPLKIFEYMAAGRTMLASDLPVLREVLAHDRNALLVQPDCIEAWTAALRRCMTDPMLVARIGAQARADFLARHSWDARAREVLQGC